MNRKAEGILQKTASFATSAQDDERAFLTEAPTIKSDLMGVRKRRKRYVLDEVLTKDRKPPINTTDPQGEYLSPKSFATMKVIGSRLKILEALLQKRKNSGNQESIANYFMRKIKTFANIKSLKSKRTSGSGRFSFYSQPSDQNKKLIRFHNFEETDRPTKVSYPFVNANSAQWTEGYPTFVGNRATSAREKLYFKKLPATASKSNAS